MPLQAGLREVSPVTQGLQTYLSQRGVEGYPFPVRQQVVSLEAILTFISRYLREAGIILPCGNLSSVFIQTLGL